MLDTNVITTKACKVVDFIDSHSVACYVASNGTIMAEDVWSRRNPETGAIESGSSWVPVAPTFKAAREFLNY